MECPVCDVTLSISSREGVEIDFCPQCRGVWLDRGELDKIIDRIAVTSTPPAPAPPAERPRSDDRGFDDRRYDDRRPDDKKRKKKKKASSFLEEIFDF